MHNKPIVAILNKHISAGEKCFPNEDVRSEFMMWYNRYSKNEGIEDHRLIELILFLGNHVDLDCYELSHYLRISDYLCIEYGFAKSTIPQMISEFRGFL